MNAQHLITRNDKMKATRALYEPLWQEIAEYMLPYRAQIGLTVSPGRKQTTKIYDSTAPDCLERWAAFIHGSLTSSAIKWFSMKLRHSDANKIKEVMDWQEQCVEIMHQNFRQSNFSGEMLPYYLDMGAFGTPCIYVGEKDFPEGKFRGLLFQCYPNNAYCIAENHEGGVDTLFREFKLSARQANQKFGEKTTAKVKQQAQGDKRDEESMYLHAVFPSTEIEDGSDMKFTSVYICLDERQIVSEGGYWEFPYIVPRLLKTSGEVYGRGRGHTALPDTKTLNKTVEIGLKRDAKELDPPMVELDQGVIGSVKLSPGGRNVVRSIDALKPLFQPNPQRASIQEKREDRLANSIRRVFNSDLLESFGVETKDETATKSLIRFKLMQMILGPSFGRFESEGLNPLIERVFGILRRARQIPRPPAILAELGILDLDVEYEGPLARAQRMAEIDAIDQFVTIGAKMSQINPESFDRFDVDEAMEVASEVLGVPSRVIRSDKDVARIRAQRAEQAQAEKQKQELAAIAEGAGKAAPAMKAMGDMMKEMGGEGGAAMGGAGGV